MKEIQIQKHLADWQESGQSKKGYCRDHNIKYHVFMYWCQKYLKSVKTKGKFVRITKPDHSRLVKIILPNGIELHSAEVLSSSLIKMLSDV